MVLLEVENLSVSYQAGTHAVRAVRDVSLQIATGETLALVGETGSGKSTVAHALLGLLDDDARVESGTLRWQGESFSFQQPRSWRHVRGRTIGMVFQDARGALNPVMTVGAQLGDALRAHRRLSTREARALAADLLAEVGIPDPKFFMQRYPFELSGGLCQRVGIAAAICHRPKLLIADEPTSALDPSIQAQILALLRELKNRHGLALLLISHDLALVAEVSENIAVMYHGALVESGRTLDVFHHPAHPYTAALLACQANLRHRWDERPLATISGTAPAGGQELAGCSFAPRCPRADAGCTRSLPPIVTLSDGHRAQCIKPNRHP
jgi:oligopeptide/dipeptide ABC transporter ATP-binding protein